MYFQWPRSWLPSLPSTHTHTHTHTHTRARARARGGGGGGCETQVVLFEWRCVFVTTPHPPTHTPPNPPPPPPRARARARLGLRYYPSLFTFTLCYFCVFCCLCVCLLFHKSVCIRTSTLILVSQSNVALTVYEAFRSWNCLSVRWHMHNNVRWIQLQM
jgi:hypothetical protein